ncbi:type II toxin-antitoxin system RelE/ParE family toxin [Terracidiphilus sp.]|uniref:type II toxin-antitoxin system RelE/ParE family toxin n=1 Tax=Terracidiphilus sp. TaxID=1964191 RepID=UPI003C740781
MTYEVIVSPRARAQLIALYDYIADSSTEEIADNYTSAILAHCRGLSTFPSAEPNAMTSAPAYVSSASADASQLHFK